jgi:hypothetical protein
LGKGRVKIFHFLYARLSWIAPTLKSWIDELGEICDLALHNRSIFSMHHSSASCGEHVHGGSILSRRMVEVAFLERFYEIDF